MSFFMYETLKTKKNPMQVVCCYTDNAAPPRLRPFLLKDLGFRV